VGPAHFIAQVRRGCVDRLHGLDSPVLLLKPRSSSCAAFIARAADEGAPSTTAISRRSSRVAVATRLNPDAQMKPVFMPSAPG
jgi:hypothetical protein